MRKRYVVGNWKMNTSRKEAETLARTVVQAAGSDQRVQVILCPPFPYLSIVRDVIQGSSILLGAQNCYCEAKGAFTGEISPAMLVDLGCTHVILGHSERRRLHDFHESSELINRKVKKGLEAGLNVIVCAGETTEERDAGREIEVVGEQLRESLKDYPLDRISQLIIAYEPVWAIGTGVIATPEQAQAMHQLTRTRVGAVCGEAKAAHLSLLYGGSVKPDNAAKTMCQPDVDGVLVGGASLIADDFLKIIKAAVSA
jgi:triosephosphate isomerase